tara:strand:+ start:415 stop:2244 length:1830 start_codon:yes stop_codon:yes gene_type:complete
MTNTREINGFIDTNNSVRDNLDRIANASGVFITWDQEAGEWSFIPNDTGSSVKSFTDNNILGSVNISGSSINELYNTAVVNFPNKDLRKTVDTVTVSVAEADRYPQELDNILNININCINDPIQAQYIASRELKQSRVDKIVQFRTDYTANGLKAGDLIDLTIDYYDFSSKVFRIISIDEEDGDNGSLIYGISALEYDADVYSTAGLEREYRSKQTDITPEELNTEKDRIDDQDTGKDIFRLLAGNLATSLLKNVLGLDEETGELTNDLSFQDPSLQSYMENFKKPAVTVGGNEKACENTTVTVTFEYDTDDCSSCFFDAPNVEYDYTITGIDASETTIPLTGTVASTGGSGSLAIPIGELDEEDKTMTVTIGGESQVVELAYDRGFSFAFSTDATDDTITEGDSVEITITGTDVEDGSYAYSITGARTDVVTTALTGNVTMTSNSGSITIATDDDSTFTGGGTITFAIDTANVHTCSISGGTIDITIEDNETDEPGTPGATDFVCKTATIPLVYCGTFDGETQYLNSLTIVKSITVQKVDSGGVEVPATVSVTNPGTATAAINIDSTVRVDTTAGQAGFDADVITSFNSPPNGGATTITGTTSTVKGY